MSTIIRTYRPWHGPPPLSNGEFWKSSSYEPTSTNTLHPQLTNGIYFHDRGSVAHKTQFISPAIVNAASATMVRDFHLKDCIGSELQTASGYRDDIIARIQDMLSTSTQSRIPEEECVTLRSMLRLTEALKGNKAIHNAELLQELGEVAKIQFNLQPQTRRQLARAIPILPTQWILQSDFNSDTSGVNGKMILAAAQLKVVTQLEPQTTKDKPILEVIDLISNEVAGWTSLRTRRLPTNQTRKRNFKSKKRDTTNGNLNIIRRQTVERTRTSQDQHDKSWQSAGAEQNLGQLFTNPKFWSQFKKYAEVFKADCGNMVPSALSVPMYRTVQLDTCVKILGRGFLMPTQLLEKTKQLECELRIEGVFEDINDRIREYNQTLLALGTEEMVLAHVFHRPEVLHDLHSEVEKIVCLSFRGKGKRSRKGNEVLPSKKELTGVLEVSAPTWAEPMRPAKTVLGPSENATNIRSVTVSQWHFKTRLGDLALNELLENEMDAGTFADVWHSTAYHVNKHAPEMLVEDYLRESQKLFTDHWIGQIERRLAMRSLDGSMVKQNTSNLWAKVVHCSMGDGCYSWQGRTIWYHPPDHLAGCA